MAKGQSRRQPHPEREHFETIHADMRALDREDREAFYAPREPSPERTTASAPAQYYGYDCAWHCTDCAERAGMTAHDAEDAEGNSPHAVMSFETVPVDSPLHCATCAVFLKNDLSEHGVAELIARLERFNHAQDNAEILNEYADYYLKDLEQAVPLFLHAGQALDETDLEGYEDEDEPHGLYDALLGCCQKGCDAYPHVLALRKYYRVVASPDIADSLKRWGAWDAEARLDHDENVNRALWLLGCELSEARHEDRDACFTL